MALYIVSMGHKQIYMLFSNECVSVQLPLYSFHFLLWSFHLSWAEATVQLYILNRNAVTMWLRVSNPFILSIKYDINIRFYKMVLSIMCIRLCKFSGVHVSQLGYTLD